MRLKFVLLTIANISSLFFVVIALLASPRSLAAQQSSDVPAWLRAHVGEGEDQIAQVVLQRARAVYLQKLSEGVIKNPCYFAMDATRPNDLGDGKLGHRFYVICESGRSFRAISAGHGGGRDLKGIADFANGRRCAKNFGNAMDLRSDGRRGLCDRRDEDVFQRLLPRLSEAGRGFDTLVRSV